MPLTVKALQKTGPDQPFRVTTIERRDPRPGDVVIDIAAAGICHSDIHTIRNEWGEAHFPLTVGHEIAGVVSAVGADVTDWEVGDRVGVGCMVNSCGTCLECRAGQEQNCLEGNVGTYNAIDVDGTVTQGGYAEKVVVDQRFVLRIPDEIAFDEAAPLLCAGITTYAPLRRWGAGEQVDGRAEKVAVLGLGGLGHMGVQIAAAMGAEVTVLSRSLRKEQDALALGASRVLATTEEGFFHDHRGEFDLILNTISADIPVDRYLGLLAPRGVMAVVGLPPARLRGAPPRRHRHVVRRRRRRATNEAPRRFRPASSADVERDGHRFEWLKPDGWREGFRALVLEVEVPGGGSEVIGVGRI